MSVSGTSADPLLKPAPPRAASKDASETAPEPGATTEFMVEMKCEGCVKNVRRNVEPVEGVASLDINLADKVVRVSGSAPLSALEAALAKTGLRSRLIGRGDPQKLGLTAAVAEFKGPIIHGVVRFTQVSMEQARVEAQFDGLRPNAVHGWSVNEYGDLTRGAASTGGCYNPTKQAQAQGQAQGGPHSGGPPAGDLGRLQTDEKGHAEYAALCERLQVWDLIGRAVVVYESKDDLAMGPNDASAIAGVVGKGLSAAVIARSAGVGENYKSLCLCDGTVIWESTDSDFVEQKAVEAAAQ